MNPRSYQRLPLVWSRSIQMSDDDDLPINEWLKDHFPHLV